MTVDGSPFFFVMPKIRNAIGTAAKKGPSVTKVKVGHFAWSVGVTVTEKRLQFRIPTRNSFAECDHEAPQTLLYSQIAKLSLHG